jgi:hypothetical protein
MGGASLLGKVYNLGKKVKLLDTPFMRTHRGKVELVNSELAKNISNTKLDKEPTIRLYRGTGTNGNPSVDGGKQNAGKWFT